jgi:PAS domain S-box-containing protein
MNEFHPLIAQFKDFDFRELPIGVYMTSLDGRFLFANRTMREMLGLPMEGGIQRNIRDLYANPTDRDAAIEEAVRLAKDGKNVERGKLHLKIGDRELHVEDYCKTLHDETGDLIGFAGCMVDVTGDFASRQHEKELQERVEELRLDIGRILHANTTTLLMVKQTLDAVAEAFEPKPYRDLSVPQAEEVEAMLTEYAQALVNAIERMIQGTDEGRRLKALPASQWKTLQEYSSFLREFKERIPTPESYSVTLRKVANEVGQIHAGITPGNLSREQMRELQNAAWHLERLTNLIEVLETRAAVIQMDYTIHSLREFITTDKREKAAPVNLSINSLIEESAKRLAEYARSLKIDIERKEVEDAVVNVIEQDVQRALTNLLHNAIKYSWRRDPERAKPAWVSVRSYVKDGQACIEFENWGVPVKREEIETGRIFELGYRGELSRDRGRLGTGIGLTDAQRVAEAHGGHLEMESHPAVRGVFNEKSEKYYRQPFLTRVRMILPLAGVK